MTPAGRVRRASRAGMLALAFAAGCAPPAHGPRAAAGEPSAVSASAFSRLDSVMRAYTSSGRAAGVVTLVAVDGRVVHHAAHGVSDLATGEPLQPDAIFRIASQTKAITSVAAMMLVERGTLSPADPVSRYIPEFRETMVASAAADSLRLEPARREITIRDLLTHTSGISHGTEPLLADRYSGAGFRSWYFAGAARPLGEMAAALADLPFADHPGRRWVYGLSTDVLGAVVERASGRSLDDFFRERIFRPLGMRDTHFFLPREDRHRLTAVHSIEPDGTIRRAPTAGPTGQGEYVEGPRVAFSGGAGLVSTARDYARFLQMLLRGGELDGARILRPETVAEMTRNQVGDLYVAPGYGFGLGFEVKLQPGGPAGWEVPGRASVGSYGWGGAYHSSFWVDPEHRLIAIFLTQHVPATGLDLRERFRDLVYDAIVGAPPDTTLDGR